MFERFNSSITSPEIRSDQKGRGTPIIAFLRWSVIGMILAPVFCALLYGIAQVGVVSLGVGVLVYVLAGAIVGRALVRTYPYAQFGLCNAVTLLRLVMVGVLVIGVIAGAGQSWAIFAFAIAALSLDGVDGWLARRENLTSTFGARFDMEVDSAFALTLSLMALSNGTAGAFVLLLGLPSYIFFAAKFALPWLDQPLPDLFSRKVVCVVQLSVLIALQLPVDISFLLAPLTLCAMLALVWSFGRDILWLARAGG